MPEKPKDNVETNDDSGEKCDPVDKSSWSEDQKNHEYYYDDAHGYEVYQPEKDETPEPARKDAPDR